MRGRWTTNLILSLIAALLGVATFFEINHQDAPTRLTGLASATIGQLTLERKGRASVRLQRTPDGWRMTDPFRVEANTERIDKLLGILRAPVQRSFPVAAASASELGLEPASIRLLLDDVDLKIGGIDPVEQSRYVAIGDLVHLINDNFYHHLIARDLDYVSPKVLPTGFKADAGVINGVALTAESLAAIQSLSAERVEPLTGETAGGLLQLQSPGGESLRFLITEGGNRWSRLDLRLSYLVPGAPLLVTDPTQPAIGTAPAEETTTDTDSTPIELPTTPYVETLGPDSDTGEPIPVVQKRPNGDGSFATGDPFAADPAMQQEDPFTPDPVMQQQDPFAPDTQMQQQDSVAPGQALQQQDPFAPDPAIQQQEPLTSDPQMQQQEPFTPAPALQQQDPFAPDPQSQQQDPFAPAPAL